MFGCFSYGTRVTLADGTQEKIGKIVNQKMDVEVLSYDPETDEVVPRRITNWFDNGAAERFLQFTVARSGGNGRSQFAATENHLIRTPGGWREAGELCAGDRVMPAETARLSDQQWQVVLGGLHGRRSPGSRTGAAVTASGSGWGTARSRPTTSTGRRRCSATSRSRRSVRQAARCFVDLTPLPELGELREVVYWGDGKKHLTVGLPQGADAAGARRLVHGRRLVHRAVEGPAGSGPRVASGRVEICVEAMSEGSRERLAEHLRDAFGLECPAAPARRSPEGRPDVHDGGDATAARARSRPTSTRRWSTSCCRGFRGRFAVEPEFVEPRAAARAGADPRRQGQATDAVDAPLRHRGRGHAQLLRRRRHGAQQPRDDDGWQGAEVLRLGPARRAPHRDPQGRHRTPVGNRTRVKVVKNKVAPPFKQAEFDIIYGIGISREGGLIDMGVEQGIVRKSGAWYTYEGDQLGQGKENARRVPARQPRPRRTRSRSASRRSSASGRGSTPRRPTPASTSDALRCPRPIRPAAAPPDGAAAGRHRSRPRFRRAGARHGRRPHPRRRTRGRRPHHRAAQADRRPRGPAPSSPTPSPAAASPTTSPTRRSTGSRSSGSSTTPSSPGSGPARGRRAAVSRAAPWRYELRQRGVDDELVQEALDDPELGDELETARALVRRRLPGARGLPTRSNASASSGACSACSRARATAAGVAGARSVRRCEADRLRSSPPMTDDRATPRQPRRVLHRPAATSEARPGCSALESGTD